MNVCQFCTVNFSTNQSLKRHYSRCKDKMNSEITTNYETQLQTQREQYEFQLQSLREQLDEFKTQLFEIAKQPKQNITNHNNSKTTNQIQNNQYNQYREYLAPMTLTQEKVRAKLLENGCQQKLFEGGKHAIIEFVIELLCEDGKQMVIRVDLNRNIYRIDDKIYVDEDLIEIRDIFTEPIKKSLLKEYSRLSEMYPKKNYIFKTRCLNISTLWIRLQTIKNSRIILKKARSMLKLRRHSSKTTKHWIISKKCNLKAE